MHKLSALCQIAWWVDCGATAVVRITGTPEVDWAAAMVTAEERQGGVTITLEEEPLRRLDRLAHALEGKLPEGTLLELEVRGEVPLRFAGPVHQGVWKLAKSPVSQAVLDRCLELVRQSREESFLEAASPSQAVEVWQELTDDLVGLSSCGLIQEGRKLVVEDPESDFRSSLMMQAAHVFMADGELVEAFGLAGRVAERRAEARQNQQALAGLTAQLNAQVSQAFGITTGEVLHRGRRAVFRRSNVAAAPWFTEEDVALSDRAMAAVGFTPLGDLTADSLAGGMLRGYACERQDAWGCVTTGAQGQYLHEFYTQFEDGGSLTTTTLPEPEARPERKIFKQAFPELEVGELLQRHREAMARHGPCRPAAPDLVALCRSIDEFLTRWM